MITHRDPRIDEIAGKLIAKNNQEFLSELKRLFVPEPIRIWQAHEAPTALGLPEDFFLTSGGDEDWVAEVPPGFIGADGEPWPLWMQDGSEFGRCSVDIKDHPHKPGWKIAIGGHA